MFKQATYFHLRAKLEKNLRLLDQILKQKAVSNKIRSFGRLLTDLPLFQ